MPSSIVETQRNCDFHHQGSADGLGSLEERHQDTPGRRERQGSSGRVRGVRSTGTSGCSADPRVPSKYSSSERRFRRHGDLSCPLSLHRNGCVDNPHPHRQKRVQWKEGGRPRGVGRVGRVGEACSGQGPIFRPDCVLARIQACNRRHPQRVHRLASLFGYSVGRRDWSRQGAAEAALLIWR